MSKLIKHKVADDGGYHYNYLVVDNQGIVCYDGENEVKATAALKEAKKWENTKSEDESTIEQESIPPATSSPDKSAPDNRGTLLITGQDVNSFATNNPKEYPTSPSANEDTSKPKKSNAEAAATIVGSGVAVASIISNAGGVENAAGDVAAAAVEAIAEKAGETIGKYTTKFVSLPLSVPGKIAAKTAERVNKTKDDKDKNGKNYDPVKITLSDALRELGITEEQNIEDNAKKSDEKLKEDKTEKVKKQIKKVSDHANEIMSKSAETIEEIMTHAMEGAEWLQQQIDREVKRANDNVESVLETGYNEAEKDIDTFCENEGNKIGARIVEEYNKILRKQAKNILDDQNKAKSKATIKGKAAIQKAKLKLFALIGL